MLFGVQVVVVQLLPALAAAAVQEATAAGPVVLVLQVISRKRLPAAAVCGVHEATGTLVVTICEQVMFPPLVHEATGVVSSVVASYENH